MPAATLTGRLRYRTDVSVDTGKRILVLQVQERRPNVHIGPLIVSDEGWRDATPEDIHVFEVA